MIRIRAGTVSPAATWRDVPAYRALLVSFCVRELKVRHTQTLLGPVWLVLQPLLQTATFTVFLHHLAGVPTAGPPYALFAYAGLLPWLTFSNGVQSLSYGLIMNAHLVSRVYFPRVLIPLSMALVRLIDFAISTAIVLAIAPISGVRPGLSVLLLPLVMAQIALLMFAIGSWASCIITRYRDFGTLLPVFLQIAMFASPVVYPSTLVPENYRALYFLNPLAGAIEAFRACALNLPFPAHEWGLSLAPTFAAAFAGLWLYSRSETRAVEAL